MVKYPSKALNKKITKIFYFLTFFGKNRHKIFKSHLNLRNLQLAHLLNQMPKDISCINIHDLKCLSFLIETVLKHKHTHTHTQAIKTYLD